MFEDNSIIAWINHIYNVITNVIDLVPGAINENIN